MVSWLNVGTLDNKLPDSRFSSDRHGRVPVASYIFLGTALVLGLMSARNLATASYPTNNFTYPDFLTGVFEATLAYLFVATALRFYDQANFPKK